MILFENVPAIVTKTVEKNIAIEAQQQKQKKKK